MADRTLRVAVSVDARGFSSLWVMLHGLLASQQASTVLELWIFHASISARKRQAVTDLAARRPATAVQFVDIAPTRFFGGNPPFGLMAYARLLMPGYLPPGRFVYLDTDVWVAEDLQHLMTGPMTAAVSAVTDRTAGQSNCKHFLANRGIAADTPYFNSGVMVIDGDAWNAMGAGPAMVARGQESNWTLPSGDQTLLNLFFRGRFDPLPERYNSLAWASAPDWNSDGASSQQIAVTHFLGRPKPWELGGWVNLQYGTYRRLVARTVVKRTPFELSDVLYVTARIVRYSPAYLKCLGRRWRALAAAVYLSPRSKPRTLSRL